MARVGNAQEGEAQGPVRVRSAPLWNERCHGCSSDCASCCNVMWCPCVHLGQMEQFFFPPLTPPQQQCCYCPQCACCITGTACVTAACCWPIMGCYNYGQRKKVRERYQYEANNTEDCCIACWCLPCSMCQVAREVKLNEFVNMARNSGQKKSILGPRKQFAEQEG